MALPDTEENTFSVTYLNGWPPDAMAEYAAGVLAMEFAKACMGGKCRLPATVSAVSRQGVQFEAVAGRFLERTTGIREVDAWIALWNPGWMRERSQVWFPGQRYPRVVGG